MRPKTNITLVFWRLLKLKGFRKFFLNFSFRSSANLLSKIIGLITLPIITRALGPEGYGNYNIVNIVLQYTILPIGLLGLRPHAIRELALSNRKNDYALHVLSMQLAIALIAILVSIFIAVILFKSNQILFFSILISYIAVIANALNLEFFFIAKKDLIFPTISHLIGQLAYVIGVVLFIKNPSDIPVLVFFAAMTPTIANIIQMRRFYSRYGKIWLKISLKESIRTFRTTYKLGLSANLENFYRSVPQMLIPVLLGSYALGIFAGGYKVYLILVTFYVTLFYALAPYLVKLNSYQKKIKRKYYILMVIAIIFFGGSLGLGLFFLGEPIIVLLLGKNFAESSIVFKALALTLIPFTPLAMLLGNILIYSGKDKYYLMSNIVSAITIIISSPLLLKNFNVLGGVYAMTIALFAGIITSFVLLLKDESYL